MGSIKDLWLRAVLGLRYGDDRLLRLLYWVRDPWGMETPRETFRFEESSRQIASQFGHVGSLLELGCGEGHQSSHLMPLCDQLYGVDVSSHAVDRARRRCPAGKFFVGDVFSNPPSSLPRVDLVVACEVLYYLPHVEDALRQISRLGSTCFVTYYEGRSDKLDRYFEHLGADQKSTIQFEGTRWKTLWWRGQWPG